MDKTKLAEMIDHTLLKPDATEAEITKLCEEAIKHKFASVCVNPTYVPLCSTLLSGSFSAVCTVIGFPLGANSVKTKIFETQNAIENGAHEIDMVINVGALKDGMDEFVQEEIYTLVRAANGKCVKVIIETALLTDEEIVKVCKMAKEAGATYVKTSTGYAKGGATVAHVRLMKDTVGEDMGVKASGGIRSYEDAKKLIESGADRLGTSAGVKIISN